MLEAYRRHYLTNNKYINSLDIIFAFILTQLILALRYPDHLFAGFSKVISWMGILMSMAFLLAVSFV